MIISLLLKGTSFRVFIRQGLAQVTILDEPFKVCKNLRPSIFWSFLGNVVSKVADMVVATAKMDIEVGWIDHVLEEIGAKRDHFILLQEAQC